MKILKEKEGKNFILDSKELKAEDFSNLGKVSKQILELISKEAMYPKQIAKELKVHEQNVYYYIKKLEIRNAPL